MATTKQIRFFLQVTRDGLDFIVILSRRYCTDGKVFKWTRLNTVAAHNVLHLEFSLCFVNQQYFFFRKLQSRRPINSASLKYDEAFRNIRVAM